VILVGIDDTDILNSRGTGRLAREIAGQLSPQYTVSGITRHQLFQHPSIPSTSHNSCAVIHLQNGAHPDISSTFSIIREMVLGDFIEGRDPGLAVARSDCVANHVIEFGQSAKRELVSQDEARSIARQSSVMLEGLGGTEDGVIGALAGIGLAASGNDGRYVLYRTLRDYRGLHSVESLLRAGIDQICTPRGAAVTDGFVQIAKFPKPALINGRTVLFVEEKNGMYRDLKVD